MNDFLKRVFYLVLGKIFKNNKVEPPISLDSCSKILIFRYDKIGDMVVSIPSFEMLKFYAPHAEIWVLASETNSFLLKNYKSITGFVTYPKVFLKKIKTIFTLRQKKFDVIINFVFYRTTKAGLFANLINPKAIKVTLGHNTRNYLYSKLFNLLFPLSSKQKTTMSEFLCQYLAWIFGFDSKKEFQTCYNFFIPEDSLKIAGQFIDNISHRIKLLVNISGRKKWSIGHYKEFILLVKQNFPEV
ncbi:MAG: glycosyltransferase family 9 protein, partial [Candidatus Kapaibacteriota bacterium]